MAQPEELNIKKLIIGLVVAVFCGVIFMPEITAFTAQKSFEKENVAQPWAPSSAYRAGKINLRFFRFGSAAKIFQRCLKTWPDAVWSKDVVYQIALCFEKGAHPEEAILWYTRFLTENPQHMWKDQAQKRIENIKANL
ncbi:MAG: outer membrane protein assembly factor BamD (BamD/ComL family) [Rhodothermales bacterium]